jgi:hypothetical protein
MCGYDVTLTIAINGIGIIHVMITSKLLCTSLHDFIVIK